MKSSDEEMDCADHSILFETSTDDEPQNDLDWKPRVSYTFTTKKEKQERMARNGCSTPSLDFAPPRPPVKSAPPRSRIYSTKKVVGPVSLSFRHAHSLESPYYKATIKKSYFEQCFSNIEKLGQGSFGEVFRAVNKEDGQWYAIKRSHSVYGSEGRKKTSLEEVKKYEMLPPHENLVKFYRAWEENQILYMQLELCGESLNQYANRVHSIPETTIWNFLIDLLFALRHLHHRDLVHMDIKPENIFITSDSTCKLGDFGLVLDMSKRQSDPFEGDSRYLAEEVVNSDEIGKPADIFSLGMTILELASDLDMPQQGELWHAIRHGVLPDMKHRTPLLTNTIRWMLRRQFSSRPTVEEILDHPSYRKHISDRMAHYNLMHKPVFSDVFKTMHGTPKFIAPPKVLQCTKGEVGTITSKCNGERLETYVDNDCGDEVDGGLFPTHTEVLSRPLLLQVASEPLTRARSLFGGTRYIDSPKGFHKRARLQRGEALKPQPDFSAADPIFHMPGFGIGMGMAAIGGKPPSPCSRIEAGEKIKCEPKNLMSMFDSAANGDESSEEECKLIDSELDSFEGGKLDSDKDDSML